MTYEELMASILGKLDDINDKLDVLNDSYELLNKRGEREWQSMHNKKDFVKNM